MVQELCVIFPYMKVLDYQFWKHINAVYLLFAEEIVPKLKLRAQVEFLLIR